MAVSAAVLAARKLVATDQLDAIDEALAIFSRPEIAQAIADVGALVDRFPPGSGAGETVNNLAQLLGNAVSGLQFRRQPVAAEVASYDPPDEL